MSVTRSFLRNELVTQNREGGGRADWREGHPRPWLVKHVISNLYVSPGPARAGGMPDSCQRSELGDDGGAPIRRAGAAADSKQPSQARQRARTGTVLECVRQGVAPGQETRCGFASGAVGAAHNRLLMVVVVATLEVVRRLQVGAVGAAVRRRRLCRLPVRSLVAIGHAVRADAGEDPRHGCGRASDLEVSASVCLSIKMAGTRRLVSC